MAKFIKSYSNFVKEVTHQYTKDGTILEREWTTVGGKNDYTPTGPVLYQSANFIVEGNMTHFLLHGLKTFPEKLNGPWKMLKTVKIIIMMMTIR